MTVRELIEKLKEFDEELQIYWWTGEEIITVEIRTDSDGDLIVFTN